MALQYSARASVFGREVTYGVDEASLIESDGRVIPLRDVAKVRSYRVPGVRMSFGGQQVSAPFERCVITLRHGPHITLASRHFLGFRRTEDRRTSYNPFIDTLVTQVRRLNPEARFIAGMPMRIWLFWLVIFVASACIALAALLMLVGLAVERQRDINAWLTDFFILVGGLSGLSFYSVLKTGWPRDYDPLKIGEKSQLTAGPVFSGWDQIFPDKAMTVAAIDRLVHHATILEMNAESFRQRAATSSKRAQDEMPATTINDNQNEGQA